MVRASAISLILVSAVTGCVSVEIPDNLVSNSMESGKNIYLDLTNNSSSQENNQDSTGIYFSNTHINHTKLPELELKSQCLSELKLTAKRKLKVDKLRYSVVNESTSNYNNQMVATCKIFVL